MKRMFGLLVLVALIMAGWKAPVIQYEFPAGATKLAQDHQVGIVTVFYMGEEEYFARITEAQKGLKGIHYLEGIFPLGRVTFALGQTNDVYGIAYIGAGGIIKDNHVLTVRHLFEHDQNTIGRRTWVYQKDALLGNEAELVAITSGPEFYDDYAVIRLSVPTGLPGLKLSQYEGRDGEPIMFLGSTGGLCYQFRYSLLSHAARYFEREGDAVTIKRWEKFDLVMTYPGGPGDSGGIIVNAKGELLGIMYCGITVYSEEYIFANPLSLAWKFLQANKLDGLAR